MKVNQENLNLVENDSHEKQYGNGLEGIKRQSYGDNIACK